MQPNKPAVGNRHVFDGGSTASRQLLVRGMKTTFSMSAPTHVCQPDGTLAKRHGRNPDGKDNVLCIWGYFVWYLFKTGRFCLAFSTALSRYEGANDAESFTRHASAFAKATAERAAGSVHRGDLTAGLGADAPRPAVMLNSPPLPRGFHGACGAA